MTPGQPLRISLPAMLLCPLLLAAGLWIAGAVWTVSHQADPSAPANGLNWAGLVVPSVAMATALTVLVASSAVLTIVVARAQRKGTANVAFVISQTFTVCRMANVIALVLLGVGLRYFLDLPIIPFFLWLIGFYAIMLIGETFWLSRTLRKDAAAKGPTAPTE